MSYDWPGNIRELENMVERAVILADGPALTTDDLPPDARQSSRRRPRPRSPVGISSLAGSEAILRTAPGSAAEPSSPVHAEWRSARSSWSQDSGSRAGEWDAEFLAYEKQRLLDVLDEAGGNKSVAARLLGMPRSTFFSKLKRHAIV
jgi:DNA-binding NtrC family response regulator